MTRRATSENSSLVGLFPFLAVLLCTMGALLVLLVVLAQRAGQKIAAESHPAPITEPETASAVDLAQQLEETRKRQQKLEQLREQGESRLQEEKERLTHLEEHTRRLEHELAKLSLAAQQLEATEKNQSVDREQAESELERLQQLIVDTEEQLEQMREEASGKHSYAIVPFKGQNGTYRKPIYIECSREGIILQPEGLLFQRSDFADLSWPGNPLAAALRASREYLNAQASRSGEPEPPDPYPLILVRPDGINQYLAARQAIASSGSDFGYEFIDGDWKIDFPDLPDPQLSRVQHHAVMLARERLARLAQAAPRRFRGIGSGSGIGGGSGDSAGAGYGIGRYDEDSPEEDLLAQASGGSAAAGNGTSAGTRDLSNGEAGPDGMEPRDGEHQYGALGGGSSSDSGSSPGGVEGENSVAGGPGEQPADAAGDGAGISARGFASGEGQYGQQVSSGSGSESSYGQAGSSLGGSTMASTGASAAQGQSATQADSAMAGTPSLQFKAAETSIAESRGGDWAIQRAMRGAVPIRRPIQVVVRTNQVALLPSRHVTRGAGATGTVISLDQSPERISDELVAALKSRVDEWGLAGNGLYWHPVLELHVGPDAGPTTARLMQLLKNSGVDIRLPETAQAHQGDRADAPR